VRVAARDSDLLLIAAMSEPPPLDEARSSLEFWRRRRARLPVYRVGARREAGLMVARWQARVAEAERLRYGTGIVGLVRRLLAGDAPSVRGLARRWVPRRLVVLAVGVLAAWLAVCVLVLAAIASLVT
jgi:hypothetical protein